MISPNGAQHLVIEPEAEDAVHLTGVTSGDRKRVQIDLGAYTFKCAETAEELEQVHKLNHRTFVREIGQYADNGSDQLVDKFHDKNRYFIAVQTGTCQRA